MKERIYQDILCLQEPRHPVYDYENLEKTRLYIESVLKANNISFRSDPFFIEGFDNPFRNIDAFIGDPSLPTLYIGSHYDTVFASPGANDNASGTAAMLELARMLAGRTDINVRLLFFTLEELNPTYEQLRHETAIKAGIWDERRNYTSLRYLEDERRFTEAMLGARGDAQSYGGQFNLALERVRVELSSEMLHFYEVLANFCERFDDPMGFGQRSLLGSCRWVEEHKPQNSPYIGMIDLDSIGYCSSKPFSHVMPEGIIPTEENSFMVDQASLSANYIVAVTNKDGDNMAEGFMQNAERLKLPYFHMVCPLSYAETAAFMPELLLADHGAFWKEGIPCLFLTDTGSSFRYPFEHTPADTIDKLDFDFMEKMIACLYESILMNYFGRNKDES